MPQPALAEKQIQQLAVLVASYLEEQRARLHPKARPITDQYKKLLRDFFPSDVLEGVRVIRGKVPEPAFYPQLHAVGIRSAPPFSQMAGITLQDLIVHVDPLEKALLFHELVHAVQYKHFGLMGFSKRYVRGFLSGGSYEEIPLEKQAYALEAQFTANPNRPFSVEQEVENRIRSHQL